MTPNDVGLSPASFHDYPEYKTPSKQYENGPITYFWGNYRPSMDVPYQGIHACLPGIGVSGNILTYDTYVLVSVARMHTTTFIGSTAV